jgi:hypothetical protein
MADGVYFLECSRGIEDKSTLGYYKNLTPFGNEGQFPDAISDVSPGFLVWETGRDDSKYLTSHHTSILTDLS